ncbi:hypothetical protein [Embleya sp. AB8]
MPRPATEAASGELVAYRDSAELLAVSGHDGDTARPLGVRAGDRLPVGPT